MNRCVDCGVPITGKSVRCPKHGWLDMRTIPFYTCKNCEETFRPSHAERTTFCGRKCSFAWKNKMSAMRRTIHAALVEERKRLREERTRVPWHIREAEHVRAVIRKRYRTIREENPVERNCRQCGRRYQLSIVTRHGHHFCSDECQGLREQWNRKWTRTGTHRQRAKRLGVAYEPISRVKLFERDGWICQICERKTPKMLIGSLNKRAPELDHIVPMSLGGSHTWSNVQCACRECNGNKGASLTGQQLSLMSLLVERKDA